MLQHPHQHDVEHRVVRDQDVRRVILHVPARPHFAAVQAAGRSAPQVFLPQAGRPVGLGQLRSKPGRVLADATPGDRRPASVAAEVECGCPARFACSHDRAPVPHRARHEGERAGLQRARSADRESTLEQPELRVSWPVWEIRGSPTASAALHRPVDSTSPTAPGEGPGPPSRPTRE